jgi:hypothetical protein
VSTIFSESFAWKSLSAEIEACRLKETGRRQPDFRFLAWPHFITLDSKVSFVILSLLLQLAALIKSG